MFLQTVQLLCSSEYASICCFAFALLLCSSITHQDGISTESRLCFTWNKLVTLLGIPSRKYWNWGVVWLQEKAASILSLLKLLNFVSTLGKQTNTPTGRQSNHSALP